MGQCNSAIWSTFFPEQPLILGLILRLKVSEQIRSLILRSGRLVSSEHHSRICRLTLRVARAAANKVKVHGSKRGAHHKFSTGEMIR